MPNYLLAIAIGPVQNFIAAARKTHDLWFGSYVLSEVSKAAALALYQQNAQLIFPAPKHPEIDLQPSDDSLSLNVANKLLALVNQEQPIHVLEQAKNAARVRWKVLAQKACEKINKHIRKDIWAIQIDDVLELYGAWVKLENSDLDNAYKQARERVEQLLKARKNTRDFKAAALSFNEEPYFSLPKSSLDAARETVLQKQLSADTRRRLKLGKNEQLDCPGVVKRLGGEPEQFSPVTRIALETWLHKHKISAEELKPLNDIYNELVKKDLATRVTPDRYKKLPFDGDLLFPDRIDALRQEIPKYDATSLELLKVFGKAQRPLYKKYGEPTPYYAVLVADGDKMGEFLDDKGLKDHQKISRALDDFADNARKIVENEVHRGASVYAGGDDVMALLPVDTAVACAEALRGAFEQAISTMNQKKRPTLSVGLGITHVMVPFSTALDVGRRAEKLAKNGKEDTHQDQQRNALALIVGVRSGAETSVRGQWNNNIVERLLRWQGYYSEQKLSSKTPYDLLEAVQGMDWAKDKENFKTIAKQEISRVLKKKRANAGTGELSEAVIKDIENTIDSQGVSQVLNELYVARWLVQKTGG